MTEFLAILVAFTTGLSALSGLFSFMNNRALAKQQRHLSSQDDHIERVHILVNSQMTQLVASNLALREALSKATGIPLETMPIPGGPPAFPATSASNMAMALSPIPDPPPFGSGYRDG